MRSLVYSIAPSSVPCLLSCVCVVCADPKHTVVMHCVCFGQPGFAISSSDFLISSNSFLLPRCQSLYSVLSIQRIRSKRRESQRNQRSKMKSKSNNPRIGNNPQSHYSSRLPSASAASTSSSQLPHECYSSKYTSTEYY